LTAQQAVVLLASERFEYGNIYFFPRRTDVERALSRHCVGRILLGPLIVWLAKRSDSPEIDEHGKESLNFQISMLIYNVIAGVLCLVLIGFFILAILHILNLVLVIVASIQASEGKFYRYPMTIRLIK
jgi:uncharacterized protein